MSADHAFEPSEFMPGGCAVCGDRAAPEDHQSETNCCKNCGMRIYRVVSSATGLPTWFHSHSRRAACAQGDGGRILLASPDRYEPTWQERNPGICCACNGEIRPADPTQPPIHAECFGIVNDED